MAHLNLFKFIIKRDSINESSKNKSIRKKIGEKLKLYLVVIDTSFLSRCLLSGKGRGQDFGPFTKI